MNICTGLGLQTQTFVTVRYVIQENIPGLNAASETIETHNKRNDDNASAHEIVCS